MPVRHIVSASLRRLAVGQGGVVSAAQAVASGLSRESVQRLVREGQWQSPYWGIYQLSLELSWLGRAWSGILLGGPRAVLGRRAAGHLTGLLPESDVIEVWVGRCRSLAPRSGLRFLAGERTGQGSPARTSVADTILDLAGELSPAELLSVTANALGWGHTSTVALRQAFERRGRPPPRSRLLRDVIADVRSGNESPLEVRYVADVERRHGLPASRRQVRTAYGRCDALYEEYGVIVELDGRLGHSGAAAHKDMSRDNAHVLSGLVTLRFAWVHVALDPCATARIVAHALSGRGWYGQMRHCPRCSPSVR